MAKWLNGSYNTGMKILDNLSSFQYTFNEVEQLSDNKCMYKFNWSFGRQLGYINIIYKNGEIENSSIIDTNNNSVHQFDRPLGLYNDNTLFQLFKNILSSIDIEVKGICSSF